MNWKEIVCPWGVIKRQREQIQALNWTIAKLKQWRNQVRDSRGRFVRQTTPSP